MSCFALDLTMCDYNGTKNNVIQELEPSELGTRDYWECVYNRDIQNFINHGDVGEVWFGEDSALRIIRWLTKNISEKNTSIVDLGCGNGMLLIELAREGYTKLTGIDYCQSAIDLSKSVAHSQQISCIKFKVVDLTATVDPSEKYDIAIDKGTYDAISLNPENRLIRRTEYIGNVARLLSSKGLFIITSCNWTEKEIVEHFNNAFKALHVLPTPKFQFGGKEGNLVSCIVLQKIC